MAEGRDPAAGDRLRKAMEGSPGWPGSAAALERLTRDRGCPVTAVTIRSWFEGAPPQIPNLLKVAPLLGRGPLEFYAAWFDEPLSSGGLNRPDPGEERPMAREPMTQNQKFALLVFALVIGVGVVLVYMSIQSGIDRM